MSVLPPEDILIAQNYLKANGEIPQKKDNEEYSAYFLRLRNMWGQESKVRETHNRWMDKHRRTGGPYERDFKQRIYIQLKELFKSNFLRNDYIDTPMPPEDCAHARQRLTDEDWDSLQEEVDGADWKLALLNRHLLKSEEYFLCDEDNVGYYISDVRKKLTWDDLEAFFRFDTFTRLVYEELDALEDDEDEEEEEDDELEDDELEDGDSESVPVIFDKRINEGKVISQIKLLTSEKVTGKRRWYVFYRVFKYLEWTKVTQKVFIEWVAGHYGWEGEKEFRGVQTEFSHNDPPKWGTLVIDIKVKDKTHYNHDLGPNYYAFAVDIRETFVTVDDDGQMHDKEDYLTGPRKDAIAHHNIWK